MQTRPGRPERPDAQSRARSPVARREAAPSLPGARDSGVADASGIRGVPRRGSGFPGTPQAVRQLQRGFGNQGVLRSLSRSRATPADPQRLQPYGENRGEGEVAPQIEAAINRKRGGGQAMDPATRTRMNGAFGADFSGVRVHKDGEADALNRALGARAFTTGRDIFFRQSEYNPATAPGKELLAHELTHVLQQGGTTVRGKLTVGRPDDPGEREADAMASLVTARLQRLDQNTLPEPNSTNAVQRDDDEQTTWTWTSADGSPISASETVEVEDYTQRFLGLFMPKEAKLSYAASAQRFMSDTAAEVTAAGHATFTHFESFARFVAKGWHTRTATMSDARRLELDPQSGSITLSVPRHGTTAGARPSRDGPLNLTSRITNTQVQPVNETHKKLVVTAKVHVNVGGSITESATGGAEAGLGGEFGPEGASVSPEATINVGGSWSITHDGGERYTLVDRTPTFIFHARKR